MRLTGDPDDSPAAVDPAAGAPLEEQEPAEPEAIRCECLRCGAHLTGMAGYRVGGQCGNCGSYDIRPVMPFRARNSGASADKPA